MSADTLVPSAGNLQSLNRYAYVLNNPVKYVDPTGHCNKDDPQDDEACWNTFVEIRDRYGINPQGLDDWGLNDLRGLLGWLEAGVRFTSEMRGNANGSRWTTANLRDAIDAFTRVRRVIGQNGIQRLINGRLAINKVAAACDDDACVGGLGAPGAIDLSLTNGHRLYAVKTMIHEFGHIVDWVARDQGVGTGFGYSNTWLQAGGWSRPPSEALRDLGVWLFTKRPITSDYAMTNPGEDFAETFAWRIGRDTAAGFMLVEPNRDRRDALEVALGRVR